MTTCVKQQRKWKTCGQNRGDIGAESTRFRRGLKIGAESARLRRGKPQVSLLLACSGSFFRACFRLGARKLVGATCF